MTPQQAAKLVIAGATLVVLGILAKHWPVWQGLTLQQVSGDCFNGQGPAWGHPSCTAIAYGQLASGLAIWAGFVLQAIGYIWFVSRWAVTWFRKT